MPRLRYITLVVGLSLPASAVAADPAKGKGAVVSKGEIAAQLAKDHATFDKASQAVRSRLISDLQAKHDELQNAGETEGVNTL